LPVFQKVKYGLQKVLSSNTSLFRELYLACFITKGYLAGIDKEERVVLK